MSCPKTVAKDQKIAQLIQITINNNNNNVIQ